MIPDFLYLSNFRTTLCDSVYAPLKKIGTSAHAPKRLMVSFPGMGTVDPGPHGQLRYRSFENHGGDSRVWLSSTPILRDSALGCGQKASTNLSRRLLAQRIFRVPPCYKGNSGAYRKLSCKLLVESENLSCESDPVGYETDEDEDNNNNESSKGLSNADECSALETSMEWYEQQSECFSTQLLLLKRITPCSENTKVYNGTEKNK
ncbi:hypothetical protein TNCV_4021471 [Trichonephila clavipes]|nr:hypothetical protein TNCV_4021471 [Trichonephila clavipes]